MTLELELHLDPEFSVINLFLLAGGVPLAGGSLTVPQARQWGAELLEAAESLESKHAH